MKLRYKVGLIPAGSLFLAVALLLAFARTTPRPSFREGSKMAEVSSYVSYVEDDERHHPRRLPPFKHTFGQLSLRTPMVMLITTEFSLRADHVFARRYVEVCFSTNATVVNITHRWKWAWNF